ncbi:hypothetical protein TCAL_13189 [Tigriopus californicus]|uniref:GST C-terminal domain-containing protein n=1 Tax=Tigriopus californicus TaxID=6832 RepID=A0A553NTD8_TIGCA|nr:uncharacterized protein LOC131884147 [Tigriopus californicus]TRY68697.1 hypothetical protein TCAL_13189 [Tigriopus californicus]|eukprot:TCALIF_13189-PA protein Name:"Similar to ovca2 Ovarian cancer-associated gene 2 protein homolog (Danio rerio)" AED:0.04 eAED:0.04 QI:48/1/1/1/1/1/2/3/419
MSVKDILEVPDATHRLDVDTQKCIIAAQMYPQRITLRPISKLDNPKSYPRLLISGSSDAVLVDPISICCCIAGPNCNLNSEILQWLYLTITEIKPFAIKRALSKPDKAYLANVGQGLDTFLTKKKFLVGQSLTVADIFVVMELRPVFQGQFTHKFPHLKRWFTTIMSQNVVQRVLEKQPQTDEKACSTDNTTKSNTTSKKPKILCLHGYRQDGDGFRTKLGALRKMLKSKAEFEFMTAPLKVPSMGQDQAESDDGQYGWWFSQARSEGAEKDWFSSKQYCTCSKGFEESLTSIKALVESHGPFDGILGFSQGAAMLLLLSLMQARGQLSFSFKFAILVAPFRSRSSQHEHWFLNAPKIAIPSLLVIGDGDKIIDREMSDELLDYFENPEILRHEGGHFVPATGQQKPAYISFVDKVSLL